MLDFSEPNIHSDQPTTCPKCGTRTNILLDLSHTKNQTQIHKCPNKKCTFEFVMQHDEDFDNGSLS